MRSAPRTTPLILVLALSAPAPIAAARATEPSGCQETTFTAFLSRFAGDASVQRASTVDPLVMDSLDSEALPEPRKVSKQMSLTEVEFPVLFDAGRRNAEGLQETVTELGPTEREVTHGVPDSDAQMRFRFRADPCWKLVWVSNDML